MKTWKKHSYDSTVWALHLENEDDEDTIIANILDEPQDGKYVYSSLLCNIEHDVVVADSLDEAKEEVEDIILSYVQDQIIYWEKLEKQLS